MSDETEVADLRARLAKAEAKAAKWKRRAKRLREKAKDTTAETYTVLATATDPSDSTAPTEEWSMTRLRAAARTEEVAGYQEMTKEQLIAALRW